jgi:hypothetical protein
MQLADDLRRERRLLQGTIILASLVPVAAGLAGIILGPAMIDIASPPVGLDSHFRYLSGVLLAIGLAFLSLVPRIETDTLRFQLLTFLVFVGGLARLVSLTTVGRPDGAMLAGLTMELAIVPILFFWQRSLSRRFRCR